MEQSYPMTTTLSGMVVQWSGAFVELSAVLGSLGLNHVVSRWVNKLTIYLLDRRGKHASNSCLTLQFDRISYCYPLSDVQIEMSGIFWSCFCQSCPLY
jgi:hypothetical protein